MNQNSVQKRGYGRLLAFVVAGALVAGAPALASAYQGHGQHGPEKHAVAAPHGELPGAAEAREAGEESPKVADAEEAEHAPAPINWFDFSNKEQPPYGAMLLNFAILMVMYYALGKKPVAQALKTRRASVAKEIEEAQKMRHEAEERALKYQEKLKHLDAELKETRETLRSAGEAERDRIVREAEEKAARMEKDAKFLVEQEVKQLRGEMTRDAIEMAVVAAEELLRKRITPADQERLAEDYLSQLTAKRPSGTQEARATAPQGAE
ncbi:MAG TPA: ATP synthase F0 subunit B [Polyangiaceae bacterium]|jgi:F-type H+-transporting ATPase subunit b